MIPYSPAYYIYILIYIKKDNIQTCYIGITNNLSRRFRNHVKGKSRTSNRLGKSYKLNEIRFEYIGSQRLAKARERNMKHYSLKKKIKISENWIKIDRGNGV